MSARVESWRAVLDRALLLGAAIWVLLQSPTTTVALVAQWGDLAALPLAVGLACRLGMIGVLVRASRSGIDRITLVAGMSLGALALVAAAVAQTLGPDLNRPLELMVPMDAIQAWQVFAVATATRFRTALVTILITLPVHLALQWGGGWTTQTLVQWVTPTSATVALAALVAYLRSGSVYASQLAVWNRDARRAAVEATVEEMARAEARRVIHDDVLSALRGVEQHAPDDAVVSAAEAALEALDEHRDVPADELLASLADERIVDLALVDHGWPLEPPAHVVEAFRGAALEALRNVARHAGVGEARVERAADGRDLVLRVSDEGRGMEGIEGSAGFGISASIEGRMRSVGGDAAVDSRPGHGTVVELRWSIPPRPPREQLTPYASEQRWRGYLPVALAITANSSLLAVLNPGPRPGAAFVLLALLVLGLPYAAWRFAFRPPQPRDSYIVAVVVSAVTWYGLHLAGPGALLDMRSWVVGFAASVTMLLAFDARARDVLVPIFAQVGVCLWVAAKDPTIGMFDPVGALTTPIVICGFSSVFGGLLRRGAHVVRQGEATLAARLEEQAWRDAQENARRVHLATLRRDVVPFLQRVVATGPASVSDREAAMLAARCRDELHLPGPLADDVRRVVDAARSRGVTVNFRAPSGAHVAWPDGLSRAVALVIELADPEVVTAVASEGQQPGRVVSLPAADGRQQRDLQRRLTELLPGAVVTIDDVRTVVEMSSEPTTAGLAGQPIVLPG